METACLGYDISSFIVFVSQANIFVLTFFKQQNRRMRYGLSDRPADGDGVGLRNVEAYETFDTAFCLRKLYQDEYIVPVFR
jgi:hypothetical protein